MGDATMTNFNAKHTIVLMKGVRYFAGFSKKGLAQFAWSLAGAKHFAPWDPNAISKAKERLQKKGWSVAENLVGLV